MMIAHLYKFHTLQLDARNKKGNETMRQLENKVAVITGGNSGIGLSTAKAFIEAGAKVAIFGRNQNTLDNAVETLGEKAIGVRGDVTNDADLEALFAEATKQFGNVDIVFANAGVAEFIPIEAVNDDHFNKVFSINVNGAFKTVQKSLSVLNDNASIILTSSGVNQKGMATASMYAASKAAVRSFARTLSAELMDRGIRVNTVSPGAVSTPIFGRMGLPEEVADGMEEQMASLVPLKRAAQPKEVADAVVYLASDSSSYMIGGELIVDGGFTQL